MRKGIYRWTTMKFRDFNLVSSRNSSGEGQWNEKNVYVSHALRLTRARSSWTRAGSPRIQKKNIVQNVDDSEISQQIVIRVLIIPHTSCLRTLEQTLEKKVSYIHQQEQWWALQLFFLIATVSTSRMLFYVLVWGVSHSNSHGHQTLAWAKIRVTRGLAWWSFNIGVEESNLARKGSWTYWYQCK